MKFLSVAEIAKKWNVFCNHFFVNGGYKMLLLGMQNTGIITVAGFAIGSLIGNISLSIMNIPACFGGKICEFLIGFSEKLSEIKLLSFFVCIGHITKLYVQNAENP